MDILDIDEMLKDDSFHFLEEKNPDDVINIIQQWKNQNCMQHQQQQQQQHELQQQQQHNETFKLDSRTFTRPKRRSAVQKLETQFQNISNGPENQQQQQQSQQIQVPQQNQRQPSTPVLNVQIGGQVRHTPLSARSMLQDTSPPSSICSSLETSLDNYNMDNSLITSADFTHLNFLLSTPSLEASVNFNEQNCVGYTLSDMIRDRKALESLTLSAEDGTLIKDSQISQIDDISLSMLKSSGCNSMANSAESMEGSHFETNDCTMQILPNGEGNSYRNATLTGNNDDGIGLKSLHRTIVMNNDNKAATDTTFTCLGNGQSFIISRQTDAESQHFEDQILNTTQNLNATRDEQTKPLEFASNQQAGDVDTQSPGDCAEDITTMKLKTTPLNETMCIRKTESEAVAISATALTSVADETYDCQDELNKLQHTPENSLNDFKIPNMYESTPHTTRIRYGINKNSYTPAIRKIIEDPNISPIIATDSNTQQKQVHSPQTTQVATTYCGSPLSHLDNMELLDNIEMPNKTYNRRSRLRQQKLDADSEQRLKNAIELQDIMDLAQAEAELLETPNDGEDDEQKFDHMLDELSRIKLNPEQIRMQKSLDKIKKRFNCTLNQGEQDVCSQPYTSTSSSEYGSGLSNTFTSETRQETLRKLRDTLRSDAAAETSGTRSNPADLALSSSGSAAGSGIGSSFTVSTMATSGSSSGERLLNRRSRLNDDFNVTTMKQLSQSGSGTDTSYTVPSKSTDRENSSNSMVQKEFAEKNSSDTNAINVKMDDNDTAKYKLTEQRERDRDRFKTIKIVRNRNEDVENDTQTILNVPCIDDDHDEHAGTPLESEGKIETAQHTETIATQRFSRSDFGNSDKASHGNTTTTALTSGLRPPEARSLSRPRYISGLQKFTVVSKAISAGDLELNENNAATTETKTSQLTRMYDAKRSNIPGGTTNSIPKPTNKLKSPMGVKAKSLHNLAYSNQGSGTATNAVAQSRIGAFGLRKINSGGFGFEQQQRVQKQPQQRLQKQPQQQVPQTKVKAFDGFTKPQPVSGLQTKTTREKSSSAANRSAAGIARPSSGYYSLNVTAKADVVPIATKQISDAIKPSIGSTGNIAATVADESKMNTGIPKPSGIRPPNKRSGLPRPSSIVRR